MSRPWRQVTKIRRSPRRWIANAELPPDPFGPQLANSLAVFTFMPDPETGIALSSFRRVGGHLWTNGSKNLWQANFFDTAGTVSGVLTTASPPAASFKVVPSGTYSSLTLQWIGVSAVADDRFDVTLTLELREGEDFLRYRIAFAWQGIPKRSALDSIVGLSLLIPPKNVGSDCAVFPAVCGILSKDPTRKLSGLDSRVYPTGRGYNMAVWGYYETVESEAWMTWAEDWSLENFSARFGRSGSSMLFDVLQRQEDNNLAGNPGRRLGSSYTFCLRPFAISQQHGWQDIGRHHKARLDAGVPVFRSATRLDRTDLQSSEKTYGLFIDYNSGQTTPGTSGLTDALLSSVRTNSGIPSATPLIGTVEAGTYHLYFPAEAAVGDLSAAIQSAYLNRSAFLSLWRPDTYGPFVEDVPKWWNKAANGTKTDDLRWWITNDERRLLRMSRQGFLNGGGDDNRGDRGNGTFERERTYSVSSWNAGTNTATVTGSPSADGFSAATSAVLQPQNASNRMAVATISLLGVSTIQTTGPFKDYLGNTVVPVSGDAIRVIQTGGVQCEHAINGSANFTRQLIANVTEGCFLSHNLCGRYFDTFTALQLAFYIDSTYSCYDAHAAWALIDSNYVRHPYGGGNWFVQAVRTYLAAMKEGGRDAQRAAATPVGYWVSVEDHDEATQDIVDFCWHTTTSGNRWTPGTGVDPATSGIRTIPLYSVVHPGRMMGRALLQEFSSALLQPAAPFFNNANLHAFMGYLLGADWPYGFNIPTLSFFITDTYGIGDFWDNSQYVSGGGTVSDTVKQLRDLWVSLVKAETTWLRGLHRGQNFLGVGVLDAASTDTTTGLSGSTFATDYTSHDTIYDRASFPRVTHGIWKNSSGTIAVICCNWTGTAAKWAATLPFATAAYTANRLDTNGLPTGGFSLNTVTNLLTITSVPAFSITAVMLSPT